MAEDTVALVFLDLAVVIALGAVLGALARRARQPRVIGEIVAGLVLGPSLLGLLPGSPTDVLFPPDVRPLLNVVAQLGLVLFMFLVGYELDMTKLRGAGSAVAAVSSASILLPFALGFGLVALLWRNGTWLPLALFIGAAMAITAFPVLARILTERGMHQSRTGALALACAAINDLLAWCLLAFVATLVTASGPWRFASMFGASLTLVVVLVFVVRPLLRKVILKLGSSRAPEYVIFLVIVPGLLVCAWATTIIGLHAVFGAFLFGAVLPKAEIRAVAPKTPGQVGELSTLLLPVFFVVAGLSVDIGALGWVGVAELVLVVLVACAGKLGGATAAGLAAGLPRREAVTVGILMNTRGLTELVVLNIGLQLGVLDERVYTIMVIMALLTTMLTGPLLALVTRRAAKDRPVLESV